MAASAPKFVEERSLSGKSLRKQTPLDSHGGWSPLIDRPNPVDLLEAQNKDRLPWLVPVRRARMSASPGLVPIRELRGELELQGRNLDALTRKSFDAYKGSVRDHDKMLLERFHPVDIALKVVGVGSVGTRCAVMLLQGRDRKDPLFLQLKQATRSVLEEHLPRSQYSNHGQRVVEGQRLMQTVSDVALGWTAGLSDGNHYYWRQLRDWKGSADVENLSLGDLRYTARLCGWTLARAHARSGDAIAIAGYALQSAAQRLGKVRGTARDFWPSNLIENYQLPRVGLY